MLFEFPTTERLYEKNFWNSEKFGGPFSCVKQEDGKYKEY